jgi:hypothetical protein
LQQAMIGEGFPQDGVVIEMITLEAGGETSVAEILVEAVAMVEMILRSGVISQIEHVIMVDGMQKLARGFTKMVEDEPHAKLSPRLRHR